MKYEIEIEKSALKTLKKFQQKVEIRSSLTILRCILIASPARFSRGAAIQIALDRHGQALPNSYKVSSKYNSLIINNFL